MYQASTNPNTNAMAPAGGAECVNCGSQKRWVLHHVRIRGIHRRLCTSCVLRLHPSSFCPSCFQCYDSSNPTPPPSKRITCSKCSSFTHSHCAPSSSSTPYLCPPCATLNFTFFDLDSDPTRPLDKRVALVLLCASKIASTSMSKAVIVARAEAERRVREASLADKHVFQKDVFSAIGWIPPTPTMNAIYEVFRIARAQTLIALCSTVPGYWFTVAFIDYMGRFAIQLMGFFFMTVFMFTLAIPYNHWTKHDYRIGFVVIYSLTFFFANFGPNATTFVVPAEIFPARLRSTCHGISAAAGKAGAIVGAFGFLYAAQSTNPAKVDAGYPTGIRVKYSLIMLGVINFFGMLFTLLVPESKGKSLEELTGENETHPL